MRAGSQVLDPAPPAPGAGGGGGGWAWLLTAGGLIEAELVRGALESSGIVPVALDGRDPSPGAWLFLSGNVNAPVRVFVPRSLLEAARLALLEVGFAVPQEPDAPAPAARAARGWVWLLAAALTLVAILLLLLATASGSATCRLRLLCPAAAPVALRTA